MFSTEEVDLHLSQTGKAIEQGDWYKITVDLIAQAAAKAVQESIYDACRSSETIEFNGAFNGVIPSMNDY